jgi:hypothetical protein
VAFQRAALFGIALAGFSYIVLLIAAVLAALPAHADGPALWGQGAGTVETRNVSPGGPGDHSRPVERGR